MPGIYDLGGSTLIMRDYIDIEGSGQNVTEIKSLAPTTVSTAGNAEIRLLTVRNASTVASASAVSNNGVSAKLTRISAECTTSPSCMGIHNYLGSLVLSDVSVTVTGPQTNVGIANSYGSVVMSNGTANTSGGANRNIGIRSVGDPSLPSSCILINSAIAAIGGGESIGIYNDYGSLSITGSTVSAKDGSVSYGVQSTSIFGFLVDRSTVEGGNYSISGDTVKIGASKMVGPVNVGYGAGTCVASYNKDYSPLDSYCQ